MIARLCIFVCCVFIVLGCDSNDSEPSVTITQVVLSLERTDSDGALDPRRTQTLRLQDLSDTPIADTLYVIRGATYTGTIRFADTQGTDQTASVRVAPETSEITYALDGLSGVTLEVTDHESEYRANTIGEDLPVGLAYAVTIAGDATPQQGTLSVELVRYNGEQKGTGATPQQTDVAFTLPFHLLRPGAQEPSRPDLITSLTHQFDGPMSGAGIGIDKPTGYQVFSEDSLVGNIQAGVTYAVTFEPFDANGTNLTTKIKNEGAWYQIFYTIDGPAADSVTVVVTDEDVDGLPLGLHYSLEIAPGAGGMEFGIRMQMAFYDPQQGVVKDGITRSNDLLVDYRLRIILQP